MSHAGAGSSQPRRLGEEFWSEIMRTTMSKIPVVAGAMVALALGSGQARAAQAAEPDPRWVPWLGCWQLVRDTEADQALTAARPSRDADLFDRDGGQQPAPVGSARSADDLTVCVTPSEAGGVTMTTRAGGAILVEDTVIADGVRHVMTQPACGGWQRAEWAIAGDRLFTRAEIACGEQPVRRVSGLMMMAVGGTWLDIQVADIEGYESVRVRQHRRARDQTPAGLAPALLARAERATFLSGGRPFTVQDVLEAHDQVSAQAVEAALVEIGAGFDLDRDTLVMLADAEVDAHLIDVMVALSYPDEFTIDRWAGPQSTSSLGPGPRIVFYGYDPCYYRPYGFSPYYPCYYSPFGYAGWGYYYGYPSSYGYSGRPFYRGGRSIGRPGGGGSGHVVNGRGYTRVRPKGSSAGNVTSSGSSGRRLRGSSGGSSNGSSGGGSVSPRGATSGGSSGGGRTAIPR